jgi:dihydroflavonol-4-reductase
MPRTWLLTGATGFVGANVARRLVERGDRVRCVIRKPNAAIEGLPLELLNVGFDDPEALARAADGCTGIFHVAGGFFPGPGGAEQMRKIHVDATNALFDAAERAPVPRVLVCSSSVTVGFGPRESPGDEDTPYDADRIYGTRGALRSYHDTKVESERIAFARGGVVVNPDYVLGEWDVKPTSGQLLVSAAKGLVPVYPQGGKCFIDGWDCADGHLLAMEKGQPGRRYLLGNWNASYKEFLDLCCAVSGRRKPLLPVPRVAMRAAGFAGSLLQRIDEHRFSGLDGRVLLAMQQYRYRSGRRSQQELGVPQTPLETTVERAWRWFREHGYC